jgi:hypothetical protein
MIEATELCPAPEVVTDRRGSNSLLSRVFDLSGDVTIRICPVLSEDKLVEAINSNGI